MKAIGITCGIGSMLAGARAAGFSVEGNIEWREYYHHKDAAGRNTFTENFPGAVLKEKYEDLTPQEIERLMNPTLALGHPESHPDLPVYTSTGWRMVSTLVPGDLVLTHRGRFRPVLCVYRRQPRADTEKITLSRNSRKSNQSVVLAGNHPVLMEDGSWKKAREVRKGEKITFLCDTCLRCSELAPVSHGRGSVSCSCAEKRYWASLPLEKRKKMVEAAHAATRKKIEAGLHDFQKIEVRRKGQVTQSRWSAAERVIHEALEDLSLERQHPVGPYFVDLAVPALKIAIEVDGGNWHAIERKKDQDKKKEDWLRQDGWTLVRVRIRSSRLSSRPVATKIQACVEEVRRLAMNHGGQYQFRSFRVGGFWTEKFDLDEILYDLSVDEDNSYVAQSLVVHNCGKYSVMGGALKDRAERLQDPSDIPLFVDLVAKLRPRFFVMDDLPKSFGAFPMSEYHERLPGYDLFPEWVSNWGYGNVQKHRNRMFMIGSLKEEKWAFVPGEAENPATIRSVMEDLGEPRAGSNFPNHDPHRNTVQCYRGLHLGGRGNRPDWLQMAEYFKQRRPGDAFEYPAADGSTVRRIGFMRDHWDRHGYVITGGNPIMHNIRCDPYTIRERARIQGFPDSFVFYGTILDDHGQWEHTESIHMVKQTGKAMPVQFCEYVSRQVAAHVRSKEFTASGRRVLHSNSHVDQAKQWYCANVGYADQKRAGESCWLGGACCQRTSQLSLPLRTKESKRHLIQEIGGDSPREILDLPKRVAKAQPQVQHQPIETKRMRFG